MGKWVYEVLGVACCFSFSENFHHSSSQFPTIPDAILVFEVHAMCMRLTELIVRTLFNYECLILYLILKHKCHRYKLCKQFLLFDEIWPLSWNITLLPTFFLIAISQSCILEIFHPVCANLKIFLSNKMLALKKLYIFPFFFVHRIIEWYELGWTLKIV